MSKVSIKQGSILALAIAIVVLIASIVIAAPQMRGGDHRQGPGQRPMMFERMCDELNLTAEQKEKVQAIFQDQMKQMEAIRQSNATEEEKRAKAEELRTQTQTQILAVLTPEQQKKAKELWAKMDKDRDGRPDGMEMILEKLNLTPEQKQQIETIQADCRKQVQAVMSDSTLDQATKAEKVAEIRKGTHEQVMAVLTPEQKQQLEQLKAKWGKPGGPEHRK